MSADRDGVKNTGDSSFFRSLDERNPGAVEEGVQGAEAPPETEVKAPPKAKGKATRGKPAPRKPRAEATAPKPSAAAVAEPPAEASSPVEEIPGVVTFGGKQFVEEDGDLLPVNAPIKMSVTMTALERQRLRVYAQERNLALVEVFREFLAPVLSGESE